MVDQTSQFYAILTNVGAAKQANADALGIPWTFSQMAVGDGNPTGLESPPHPMPVATQTALLNEWRRAPLNQLKVDPSNAAVIIAEQIIPADVGGKWIREIALYDADGDMVAVANCPPTFKPLLSQGSGRTQVVRLNLLVSSISNVQLKIDPAIVLATREWVTEELAKQDFKHSVVAATTASITLSGLQNVDGVALTAGARVLVKNQAAAKDNGLYLVVAGGAWTRCTDADSSAKVTPGMLVLVERGTVNADSAWQLVTDATITLGVTALTYEMAFGRTGVAAGTYRSVTVDAYGRVTAASNPTTVAGYGLTDVYTKTQVDTALALKAPLASPVFTGNPVAPTQADGDSDTSIANTAFVQRALALLGLAGNAASVTDANTISSGGLYSLATTSGGGLNGPSQIGTVGWYIYHLNTATSALQIAGPATGVSGNKFRLFHRQQFGGAWSDWKEFADTDSPSFIGTPTAPTAAPGTNTDQVATMGAILAGMLQYGIGGTAPLASDLDAVVAGGVYRCTSTAASAPGTGCFLHIQYGSAGQASVQVFVNTTSGVPTLQIRSKTTSTAYGAWFPIANAADLTAAFAAVGLGGVGATVPTYTVTPAQGSNVSATRVIQALATDDQATVGSPVAGQPFGGWHIIRAIRPAQFGVAGSGSGASLWYRGFTGASPNQDDWQQAAPVSSPALTGTPTAPTPGSTDNSTQLATTAFVQAQKVSPALTGTPTAPTQAAGNNTTRLATTAFVQAAIAALVASSPAALDTLKELADALGNDPNFATTMATQLGLKAPLASPDFTGTPTAPNGADGDSSARIATTSFVQKTLGMAGWGQDGQVRGNLGAGVNLDTIRTPGSYGQPMNTNATLALNYPVTTAGTLLVQAASTTITTQEYTQYNTGKTWTRAFYNSWSPWIEGAAVDSPIFTGSPKAPTASKFDASKLLATTEFVQSALGNLPGDPLLVTANTVLTAAQAGNLFIASNAITITLPAIAGVVNGSTYHFLCTGGSVQIKGNGSEVIQGLSGANIYKPLLGEKVSITKRNNAWYLSGGGVGAESFTSNLVASGWMKFPSGLVMQWMPVTTTVFSNGFNLATLPIAFPNTNLFALISSTAIATGTFGAEPYSLNQVRFTNSSAAQQSGMVLAFGF